MDQGQLLKVFCEFYETKHFSLLLPLTPGEFFVVKEALKQKPICIQAFHFILSRFLKQNRELTKPNKTHKKFCSKPMLQKSKWIEAMKI